MKKEILLALLFFSLAFCQNAQAQTTEFTFQGSLKDNASPANANYDFEFALFDTATVGTGTQFGATIPKNGVLVAGGLFSVKLDFGSVFPGANRFLEIRVRLAGQPGITTLGPRQMLNSAPYAIRSLAAESAVNALTATNALSATTATTATNATQLGGIAANQYIVSGATTINAGSRFSIGGTAVLRLGSGLGSLFVGDSTGSSTTGGSNSYFGSFTGNGLNATGISNSFFGNSTGAQNTTGSSNAFFGSSTGNSNITGNSISLFGSQSDTANGLFNATAIGAKSYVSQSNSLVLGGITGVNNGADTNVGIGTTAPARRLHVANGVSGATSLSTSDLVVEDDASAFQHFLTPNDVESGILFGDVTDSIAGGIIFNNATTNNGIQFRAGGNTTRMTLDGSGSLGIGTTSPADMLDVNGDIRVGIGTNGCIKDSDGTVLTGACSSDLRFKRSVAPFGSVLGNFTKLRPVHFYWRSDEYKDKHFGTRQSYGLIAQDVEMAFPELVTTDQQGFKLVNYAKLPLLTIQAIKEQQTQIKALEKQHRLQEARIEAQQKQIEVLLRIACEQKNPAEACKQAGMPR